jgi:hypothetical protein
MKYNITANSNISKYAWKEILKRPIPFTFHFGIKKWKNTTVEKRYVTLTHFMLVGKSTDTAVHTIMCCSHFSLSIFFFWVQTLPLQKLEVI